MDENILEAKTFRSSQRGHPTRILIELLIYVSFAVVACPFVLCLKVSDKLTHVKVASMEGHRERCFSEQVQTLLLNICAGQQKLNYVSFALHGCKVKQ